jgi:hypothetical protein
MRRSPAVYAAFVMGAFGYCYVSRLSAGVMGPEDKTRNSLHFAIVRVQEYAATHHRLPDKLSDLAEQPGTDERLVDGAGKPLAYEPHPDGSVSLRSAGHGPADARAVRFSIIDISDTKEVLAMFATLGNMEVIERFIRHYASDHQRLPNSLSDLPASYRELPGQSLSAVSTDGWGGTISYAPRDDVSVSLSSTGKDGKQVWSREFTVAGMNSPTTATTQR